MLLTVCLAAPLLLQDAAPEDPRAALQKTYHAAYASSDEAAMAKAWRENPTLILGMFDSDLEAGLAAWEKKAEGHEQKTAESFSRAVWGAKVASDALAQPIFHQYANAFTSWDAAERKLFRRGQAAYGEARQALRAKDGELALTRATECVELALSLGDWWGAAMGLWAQGAANEALDKHGEAAVAYSSGRFVNRMLGLAGSEYRCLLGQAESLVADGKHVRGHFAANEALAMGKELDDKRGVHAALTLRLRAEQALGRTDDAKKTEAEIAGLEK